MPKVGGASVFDGGTIHNPLAIEFSGSAGTKVYSATKDGEAYERCYIKGTGTIAFGPGNAAADVFIYRAGVGQWKTINDFSVGKLGVGNSALATVLGTVVGKIEIFDDSYSSLGFIPIYDAIS